MGVANRKSVAWFAAKTLESEGAKVVYSVRSETRKETTEKLLRDKPVYVCDVENVNEIAQLAEDVSRDHGTIHGIVHSIAFANYADGFKPFHETKREDYLQATAISSFSIVEVANAFKPHLDECASVEVSSNTTGINAAISCSWFAKLDVVSHTVGSPDKRIFTNGFMVDEPTGVVVVDNLLELFSTSLASGDKWLGYVYPYMCEKARTSVYGTLEA